MSSVRQQISALGFSSDSFQKLDRYATLIAQWNKAINLVAPSTLPQLWERHILDSAQLWLLIDKDKTIIDLGSGGGLPGIVLAIAGAKHITMVESDTRKCVFLREVSRETKLDNVTVINERIEKAQVEKADFVTARALAPLSQLIEWATPFLKENGRMVFLKGADVQSEIDVLPIEIKQKIQLFNSVTDKNARIILI
jgi:16S rRNA (guanine527-N7)-methyltransferase